MIKVRTSHKAFIEIEIIILVQEKLFVFITTPPPPPPFFFFSLSPSILLPGFVFTVRKYCDMEPQ